MVDLADAAPRLIWHIRQIHAPDIVAVGIPGEGQVSVLHQKGVPGVPDGLGAMIMDARLAGRVDLLVSGIILIALVGWLCDVLLMRALSAVSVSLRRQ